MRSWPHILPSTRHETPGCDGWRSEYCFQMPFSLKRHRGVLYGAVTVRFMRTDTYDPPTARSDIVAFILPSISDLIGALVPAVVKSGVVDSERKIDANDPTRTSTASARARLGVRSSNLFGRAILCGEGLAGPCAFRQGVSLSRRVAVALAQKYRKQPHAK